MNAILDKIDINSGYDIYKEIDEYETVIRNFFDKKIHPERFKSYRLIYGTYGVRHHEEGTHMQRIKIPGGFILSDQMKTIAELTRDYAASGHAHITTRQDIQLHYVALENIPALLRRLANVGITTREACGNSIRNITASYLSGINPNEIFDIVPYALYCTRYFLRHPLSSTLPRKFKISFSESDEDFAYAQMHDIGAIARIENGERGFKVYAGGGLGAVPMTANLLTEFINEADFFLLIESALRVFHKHGKAERENRNKARMKFFISRVGFEKFRELTFAELKLLKKTRNIGGDLKKYIEIFPLPAPTKNGRDDGLPNNKRISEPAIKEFIELRDNRYWDIFNEGLIEQRQKGYTALLIKPELGNLNPEELNILAEFSDNYGGGYALLTPAQNILIPWINNEFIYDAYNFLAERSFFKQVSGSTRDIVSCPGAFSCRLAVTHPYNLAHDIGLNNEELGGLRIHISGCPNSCGQHHIGDIGLYGASIKSGGGIAPHYVVLLGGNIRIGKIGKVIGKIPARHAHNFIARTVELWNEEKNGNEQFHEFVDRLGFEPFRKILADYAVSNNTSDDLYKEPGFDENYKMEAESRGECAGSLLDLMAVNLFDSIRNIYEAQDDIKAGLINDAKRKCLESILLSSKMFVFLEGIEPETENDILSEFVNRIAAKNWLCNDWSNLKDIYYELKNSPGDKIDELFNYSKEFVYDCDKSFVRLQPNLKIQQCINN
ncbi:putative sulfite reductase, contains SirA-like domain [Melioribacter roseus P3M-2]|uniref:Putative sulfite reductase, contains SirA-like domain n=1 Tax=Melioribacter roseus (strain DSM 23840 / JCM 17771 / VKM B-2668 / P3M-2) TaxID=1191523 RepID=I6YU75_MELRP|nr:nitrite/sulfite reductase [Melioribacter roseus]AFN74107.1 putative sulfite reductase, contains SirA-like domain [Melioribacter roseus P3M-2]